MSDAITNAKSWELASIVKGENGSRIVFGEEVRIYVGDREVTRGLDKEGKPYKRLSLFINDAVENLNYKLDQGYIDQSKYNQTLETLKTNNIAAVVRGSLA